MIRLFAPKQLKLSLEDYLRNMISNISERSAMLKRSFLLPLEGEKSFISFLRNYSTEKPFYISGDVEVYRGFSDPLGVYQSYVVYVVKESFGDLLHTMEYVDNPDDYLHIDNPYRCFVTDQPIENTQTQPAENNE